MPGMKYNVSEQQNVQWEVVERLYMYLADSLGSSTAYGIS